MLLILHNKYEQNVCPVQSRKDLLTFIDYDALRYSIFYDLNTVILCCFGLVCPYNKPLYFVL